MKKNKRIIAILLALCLALISYALVINFVNNSEEDGDELILSSLDDDNITSFSYKHYGDEEYGDDEYCFIKENDIWYYNDDRDFPVNQNMAISKVKGISEVTAKRVVEENPKDIAQYGLETPYLTVSILDENHSYTYNVGNYNSSTQTYYVMQDGEDVVYLADSQLFIAFDIQLWDMLKKEEIPEIDEDSLKQISFKFSDDEIILKKEKLENDYIKPQWYLLNENKEIIENTNKIETAQYTDLVTNLSYLRAIDYKCDESDYPLYGFDNPNILISITYDNNGVDDELVFIVGTETSENYIYEDYYIKSNKSEAVMTISYELLEKITALDKKNMVIE